MIYLFSYLLYILLLYDTLKMLIFTTKKPSDVNYRYKLSLLSISGSFSLVTAVVQVITTCPDYLSCVNSDHLYELSALNYFLPLGVTDEQYQKRLSN